MTEQYQRHSAGYFQRTPDSSPPVHLIQREGVRDELNRRLQQEIADLERRVLTLQGSGSPGSEAIVTTYERMIENKRQFIAELDQ